MSKKTSTQIKHLTVSAVLCALGVVLLALGAFIEVIDLSVSVIASLLVVYAVIEIKGMYPWLIWIVTSLLSLLLLPIKTPVLFYALLTGFYPILKEKVERLPRIPAWALKLLIFHLSLGVIYAVMYLFLPNLLTDTNTLPMLLLLYGMSLVCFLLFDVCLTRLITVYFVRLRDRFRIR